MSEPDSTAEPSVAVIGAGAAGLMAALFAARGGARVTLLERTSDGGRKILISGGGRCNILPSVAEPDRYVTESSGNTLRKLLRSWPLHEQRAFFETELGMALVLEEESGKLFPASDRARDVRDGLVSSVREAGARVWFDATVEKLTPHDGRWRVETGQAPALEVDAVVLATGGRSVPKTGSDGMGLELARTLGHTVHDTYPALTPLTANPSPHAGLAGVSLPVTIRAPGAKPRFETTGGFLFTHRGWSGPAVLDASHLAIRGKPDGSRQELHVQWTPEDAASWERALTGGKGTLRSRLTPALPRRLVDRLLAEIGVAGDTGLAALRKADRRAVIETLTSYRLPWTGDEGYRKAEVTGGGIALWEVDPRTLESRRHPGLYLCGEILDAFGPIGGHNFLWAWATGRGAGLGASRTGSYPADS
jgi:predicted Rossmann fold flavoprotein